MLNLAQVNDHYIRPASLQVVRGSIAELLVAVVVPAQGVSSLSYDFLIITDDIPSEGMVR